MNVEQCYVDATKPAICIYSAIILPIITIHYYSKMTFILYLVEAKRLN